MHPVVTVLSLGFTILFFSYIQRCGGLIISQFCRSFLVNCASACSIIIACLAKIAHSFDVAVRRDGMGHSPHQNHDSPVGAGRN